MRLTMKPMKLKAIGSAVAAFGICAAWMLSAVPADAQGYFTLSHQNGTWQLMDPDGRPFFIRGVHGVRWAGDGVSGGGTSPYQQSVEQKYGSEEAWAKAAVAQLGAWGFNTIGASSDTIVYKQNTPFVYLLGMSNKTAIDKVDLPDVFDRPFIDNCYAVAQRTVAPQRNNRHLIGWFTDNELHWSGDYKGKGSILQLYLKLPHDSAGYEKALAYCQGHGLNPDNTTYPDAVGFRHEVAEQYFKVTHDAIKQADPNHLILGCRFATPGILDEVISAMGDNVDVVSWNHYKTAAPIEEIDHIAQVTGHPVLISEFSIVARDSGLPNSVDTGAVVVDTQQERAQIAAKFTTDLYNDPNSVGYIWFKYTDNPPQGSATAAGENANWGLVDNNDRPYAAVTEALKQVNEQARQARGNGR